MPQNIVLCFDGTNNEFGVNNTNVVRLAQVIDRDAQRLYYDPGVGTLPDPRMLTRAGQTICKWIDLAFAKDLTGKIEAAYTYLMDFWEPDSKVFMFGFSRGAYTARVLAGLLHSLGLLSRGNHHLVPYVMQLFRSIRGGSEGPIDSTYWSLCNSFRWSFARATDNDSRHFKVHFLGLWDTVSSVGWVWDPATFRYTATNPSVINARHAVSIDERRAFFRQNLLNLSKLEPGQDWKEVWFPGVHCDVGGGYPENEGALWLVAFLWMIAEATQHGLAVNSDRINWVRNHHGPPPADPWMEPTHESLQGFLWNAAEYYPKRHWRQDHGYYYAANRGSPRFIHEGALIHESALLRIRRGGYSPRNFFHSFIEKIRSLPGVPTTLAFESDRKVSG